MPDKLALHKVEYYRSIAVCLLSGVTKLRKKIKLSLAFDYSTFS